MFQPSHFFRFSVVAFILTTTLYSAHAVARDAKEYIEIKWTDLMPSDDLEALLNAPDFFDEIDQGSGNDSLDMLLTGDSEDPRTTRYLQALGSMSIVEEYDQKRIRIPGFIVPLVSDEKQNITEFFIVPYFGACLHLPPPPPNQILHVKTDKKVRLNGLQDAYWFEGQVNIEATTNLLGKSAYTLHLENITPYEE